MIVPHSVLNAEISNASIDEIAEREGYEKFLPYTFVKHLVYSFSFYLMGELPETCVQIDNSYTKQFLRVIKSINYSDSNTRNPLAFAIKILKLFQKKINLRKLELAACTGMVFDIESDKYQNYSFDLHNLSVSQLDILCITSDNLDTIELDDEIQKILLLYDGMSVLKQPVSDKYEIIKDQLQSYSDFYKGRRYKLALPTFNVDLGMKKLQITKIDDSEVRTSEVVIVIDASISMSSYKFSNILIRSVLLYYSKILETTSGLSITIHWVVGDIISTDIITNVSELKTIYSALFQFRLPIKGCRSIFNELNIKYPGKSIIFLSDGNFNIGNPIKLKYKLYSIVLSPNETLKQMSLLSGGQFIVLK